MAAWRAFAQPPRYAALAAGALPVLAFPALNLEFLGWCGLVPGMAIIRAAPSAREAAVRGWWLGAGFLLAAMYWLAPNIGPGLLLIAVVLGALWTGFGVATWALLRAPVSAARALAALVVLPSYWLLTEWARSWQGFGGPWAVLGTSQWQHPVVLALASVGGVWLISFILVAANTGILIAATARGGAARAVAAAGTAAAIAAGPVAFALTTAVPAARSVTVALVQPGITRSSNSPVSASLRLSRPLAADHPDLIVWGESSVGNDVQRDPVLYRQIRRLAAATGAEVLVNQDAILPGQARSKVALLIGRHGVAGSYTKTRLVPFGEYIPLRGALGWLTRISRAAPSNMVPGHGAHLVHATTRDEQAIAARRADLLRVRLPGHVPGRYPAGRPADRLPDVGFDVPVELGPGPARRAGRGARRGDRAARGAGGTDRGQRRVRPARAAAGADDHPGPGGDRAAHRPAPRRGADPL